MKPFLFGERNGVHIVDLDQTLPRLEVALEFLRRTVGVAAARCSSWAPSVRPRRRSSSRPSAPVSSTSTAAGSAACSRTSRPCGSRSSASRSCSSWSATSSASAELSKKELSRVNRWIEKYKKSLDGIKEMTRLPDALFVIDVGCEAIAIKEAQPARHPDRRRGRLELRSGFDRLRGAGQRRLAARDPALLRARRRRVHRGRDALQRARAGGGRRGGAARRSRVRCRSAAPGPARWSWRSRSSRGAGAARTRRGDPAGAGRRRIRRARSRTSPSRRPRRPPRASRRERSTPHAPRRARDAVDEPQPEGTTWPRSRRKW